MASYAHAAHPNQQQYLMVRADIAAQGFEHIAFTIEELTRLVKRVAASVKPTLQRWAAAHQQAVQDRLFWELALTDRRLMAEIRAIQHHAEQGQ